MYVSRARFRLTHVRPNGFPKSLADARHDAFRVAELTVFEMERCAVNTSDVHEFELF